MQDHLNELHVLISVLAFVRKPFMKSKAPTSRLAIMEMALSQVPCVLEMMPWSSPDAQRVQASACCPRPTSRPYRQTVSWCQFWSTDCQSISFAYMVCGSSSYC